MPVVMTAFSASLHSRRNPLSACMAVNNLFALRPQNAPPHLCWLDPTQIAAFAEYNPISIYLGRDRDNHAYIALDISACDEAAARLTPGHFADLREASPLIGGDEGSILAYARALCFWHQRHDSAGSADTRQYWHGLDICVSVPIQIATHSIFPEQMLP